MRLVLALLVATTAVARADVDSTRLAAALDTKVNAAAKLTALFADAVAVGPMLFYDETCQRRFGDPVVVKDADRAALATCITSVSPSQARALSPLAWSDNEALFAFAFTNHAITSIGPFPTGARGADAKLPTLWAPRIEAIERGFAPSQAVHDAVDKTETHAAFAAFVSCSHGEAPIATRLLRGSDVPGFDRDASAYIAKSPVPAGAITFADRGVDACLVWWLRYDASMKPSPPNAASVPPIVPPAALEANRVAGSKLIDPDDATKAQIAASNRDKIVGTLKLCVDAAGAVSSIKLLKSTGYPAYDDKIVTTIRDTWRYRPFLVNGVASPVCTAVTFIYSQN